MPRFVPVIKRYITMQQKITTFVLCSITFVLANSALFAQTSKKDSTYKRHFVGSSFFMLANLGPEAPHFYQLNYGYRITPVDVVSIEAITWTYNAPLGIPYGPSKESKEEHYPGSVHSVGLGLAYQCYFWKNFYTALHALPLLQTYRNEKKETIQQGFQLFCTFRMGYHLKLFKNKFFLEPSLACTYWPINTNMPESFKAKESKWSNYFLFEPGLHFGYKF
jgi:hypothetical protein